MKNSMSTLRIAVAWLVVAAWLASIVLDAVWATYQAPATIHALMLIVAGFLFGPTITGRGKKDEE